MRKIPTGRFVKVHSIRKNRNGTIDVLFAGAKKKNPRKKKKAAARKTTKRRSTKKRKAPRKTKSRR